MAASAVSAPSPHFVHTNEDAVEHHTKTCIVLDMGRAQGLWSEFERLCILRCTSDAVAFNVLSVPRAVGTPRDPIRRGRGRRPTAIASDLAEESHAIMVEQGMVPETV